MTEHSAEGQRLFDELRELKVYNARETELLDQACRTADDLHRLEVELTNSETIVRGSTGQIKPNPLFAEVRATRALLSKLIEQATVGVKPSVQKARGAARARWGDGATAPDPVRLDRFRRFGTAEHDAL